MSKYFYSFDRFDTTANNASAGDTFGARKHSISGMSTGGAGDTNAIMASILGTVSGCSCRQGFGITYTGSTKKFNWTGHPLKVNQMVMIAGTVPNNYTAFNGYYVIAVTTNDFQLSATRGGGAVNATADVTGIDVYNSLLTVPAGNHKILDQCSATTNYTAGTGVTLATQTTHFNSRNANALQATFSSYTGGNRVFLLDLGSQVDLSSWSAIMLRCNIPTTTTGLTLRLYSDVGTTELVALSVPSTAFLPINNFVTFTDAVNALPNNVRSIQLELTASQASGVFLWIDLYAYHDPHVNANGIAGERALATSAYSTGDWYGPTDGGTFYIWSPFDDTSFVVMTRNGVATVSAPHHIYPYGDLNNATLQTYQIIECDSPGTTYNTPAETVCSRAGSAASRLTISGGWNRTDMATQDANGITFLRYRTGAGTFNPFTGAFIQTARIGCCLQNAGTSAVNLTDQIHDECLFFQCFSAMGASVTFTRSLVLRLLQVGGPVGFPTTGYGTPAGQVISVKFVVPNSTIIMSMDPEQKIQNFTCYQLINGGIFTTGGQNVGYNIQKLTAYSAAFVFSAATYANVHTLMMTRTPLVRNASAQLGKIQIERYGGTVGDCRMYGFGWESTRDTNTVNSPSTESFKLSVTSSALTSTNPCAHFLGTVFPSASITGKTVTVTIAVRKNSANIVGRLRVRGGIIVATDQTADNSAASANVWTNLSVSFTAIDDSPIAIQLEGWSTDATSSLFFDTPGMTVTAV